MLLAKAKVALNEVDVATRILHQCLRLDPSCADTYLLLARIYHQKVGGWVGGRVGGIAGAWVGPKSQYPPLFGRGPKWVTRLSDVFIMKPTKSTANLLGQLVSMHFNSLGGLVEQVTLAPRLSHHASFLDSALDARLPLSVFEWVSVSDTALASVNSPLLCSLPDTQSLLAGPAKRSPAVPGAGPQPRLQRPLPPLVLFGQGRVEQRSRRHY